jgi:hypothetical protein
MAGPVPIQLGVATFGPTGPPVPSSTDEPGSVSPFAAILSVLFSPGRSTEPPSCRSDQGLTAPQGASTKPSGSKHLDPHNGQEAIRPTTLEPADPSAVAPRPAPGGSQPGAPVKLDATAASDASTFEDGSVPIGPGLAPPENDSVVAAELLNPASAMSSGDTRNSSTGTGRAPGGGVGAT